MSVGAYPASAEPFPRPPGDEPLRARTGIDPARLDADDAPRPVLGRRGDPDQRDHFLRRETRDRRRSSHRPARGDVHLCPDGALPLHDVARDHLCDLLDDPRFAEDGVADRLVEHLREPRHVHALLAAGQVDGALDLGSHHRLGITSPDANRLLHAGHTRAREGEFDGRRGCLHVRTRWAVRPCGHVARGGGRRHRLPRSAYRRSRDRRRSSSSLPPVWHVGQYVIVCSSNRPDAGVAAARAGLAETTVDPIDGRVVLARLSPSTRARCRSS